MCGRAIVEVAKEAGKKLLTGNFNLINLSMPVKMSEPRSYLQKLADVWVYPRSPSNLTYYALPLPDVARNRAYR